VLVGGEDRELAIVEVVDGRREQQAILPVQALVVGLAIPPRLAVAGGQVFRPINPRDAAGVLDARHALAKLPLPAPLRFK